ncbi:MAG TPA: UDP-N-acetylmuramate dehydrogenase [Candidatus Saccharimonadales bacterium]|nr:UDP-N-acetylmuramate dehydrogenase [Candidatus Saccharimonadales bacterium]
MLRDDVLLKEYSNYKIGGPAAYFLEVSSIEELISGLKEYQSAGPGLKEKIFILGKGTNVLISDEGFDGLVILNKIGGIEQFENHVVVGSGCEMPAVVQFAADNSLSGLEWAGGLPGTVGGAVRGNAGAFGGETKDSILEIESIDLKSLELRKRNREDCKFGYRMSVWKSPEGEHEMITKVTFKLQNDDKKTIEEKTQLPIDYRTNRHPLDLPNIGSIFKNIPYDNLPKNLQEQFESIVKQDPFPVVPVAKLLVYLELKGKRVRDAQVSEKHPNFIVNLGNAKAADVKSLISIVKEEVHKAYGIDLEEEVMMLG